MTYIALIRGINVGGNALIKMDDLKKMFLSLGFSDITTLGISGNVVFTGPKTAPDTLARKIEAPLKKHFKRDVLVIVREREALRKTIASDPFKKVKVSPDTKLLVTFLDGKPATDLKLPFRHDGGEILSMKDSAVFNYYVRGPNAVKFMSVLEKTLGKNITTRTLAVVEKLLK